MKTPQSLLFAAAFVASISSHVWAGVSLDANGWTVITPSADSRVVYVSNAGNDANDGLTPATAKATMAAGNVLLRDGFPDHLLLRRGDTFTASGSTLGRWKNGRSATEPIVLSSYGAGGARPVIVVPDGLVDHNGQTRNYQAFVGLDVYKSNSDPASPDFANVSASDGLRFVGGGADLLIEDCRFRCVGIVVQSYDVGRYTNLRLRRNIVVDTWVHNSFTDGNQRIQGLYVSGVDGYLIEENFFDHNGWNETVPNAGANQFNHNIYIQYDNAAGGVMRGNIITRGAAHGLQARSSGVVERNLFALNAVAMNVGGNGEPTDPAVETWPNTAHDNVILNGRLMSTINSDSPRTAAVWGIWEDFYVPGASIDGNIVANRIDSGSNSSYVGIGNMDFGANISYHWDPSLDTNDPSWPHPDGDLGGYHASIGGADSTDAYLTALRERPPHELPWNLAAYAAINYIRAGFGQPPVPGYFAYPGNPLPIVTVAATADATEPASNGQFTFTASPAPAAPITVNLSVAGTATSGVDFTIANTVTIGPSGSATIDVNVLDDSQPELPETAVLTILTGFDYLPGQDDSATVTIADEDSAGMSVIAITANDSTAAEHPAEAGQFTVTANPAPAASISVNLTIAGSATNGTDYTAIADTVTIDTSGFATIDVSAIDDTLLEPTEDVVVSLANGDDYLIGLQNTATVTIADGTPVVTIAANDATAGEPANPGEFTVTANPAPVGPITVNLTSGGTATNGTDFASIPATVIVGPSGAATIDVSVNDDIEGESPETVTLTLASGADYLVGSPDSATVTISDNDSDMVALPGGGHLSTEIASQAGVFTVTFAATPSAAPVNSVIGLSNVPVTAYNQYAAAVRFNPSGFIDARDGGVYAAATSIPYAAEETYQFRLVIDVPTHTYSAYVTLPGGSELAVGTNYAFRTEQNAVPSLNYWVVTAMDSPAGTSVIVADFMLGDVLPPPSITTTSLSNGAVGSAYSQTLAAEGGSGELTWSVDSGDLPVGLSLAADGVLSGTPTAPGTSTFTVTVTDEASREDMQELSITVVAPGAVTASVTPTRTSGVAPLAVYFDSTGTTASTTSRPFHELHYEWNYGDPGSGVWATSGKSKNRDLGPNGGHLFETPGTYTVSLTVMDATGTTDTETVTITVQDPDVVFSGANTICISTDGVFSGAPIGAQLITSDSWATISNALGTGKRVLLKRGNAWNYNGVKRNLTFNGPGILGAFGTGPRPILRFTSSNSANDGRVFWMGTGSTPGQFNDFRFMDLEIDGAAFDRGFLWAEGEVDDITLLRVSMHDGGSLMVISPDIMNFYNQNGQPGHKLSSGIALVETEFDHMIGPGTEFNGRFIAYLGIQRSMILGSTWTDSVLGEHVLRFPLLSRGLIGHNVLTNTRSLKHVIKLHASALPTISPTQSEYVAISDNFFASQLGDWLISVGPQNNTSNEVTRDIIVERNHVTIATGYQTAFHLCASETTVRNNTVIITSEDGGNPVTIARRGTEPPPVGNSVFHNSAYYSGAGNLTFVSISSSASDTTVRNNLGSAPNSTDKSMISGAGTNLQESGNVLTDAPGWLVAAPATPAEFHLISSSPAIDAGSAAPVFTDFVEASRPQGAAWDLGAFEYSVELGVSAPLITTTALPNGIINRSYSQALSGQGGDVAQVWSLVSGALPPGLRLAGASILGTPTATGLFTFTVKLADLDADNSAGDEDTAELTITIEPPPNQVPVITTIAVPAGTSGVAYSRTLQATGGDGALVWSLDSGALPDGIALSTAGVLSGTSTTPGTSTFTVRVADGDAITGPADEATRELVLTVNPTGSQTVLAGPAFTNTLFAAQSGTFTVTFSAKPSSGVSNTVMALASSSATAFSQLAAIVRFSTTGSIDARNGGVYTAATSIPYAAGQTYQFRLVVDVPAHTYSAYVTPPGGSELTIGSDFAFRTEQNTVTTLNTFVVNVGEPADGWVEITDFNVVVPATVTLGNLAQTYDGTPKPVSVATVPAGLPVNVTYDGSTTAPTNVGSYAVIATITDPNFSGSASGTLTIHPASAVIAFHGLRQTYDGTPKSVLAVTDPSDLPVIVTYVGSVMPPTLPGTYDVEATINHPNYQGAALDQMIISITALVRHAPTLNAGVDGSVQMLNSENVTLNGSAWISGDLLVRGSPKVKLNGHPVYGGTLDASGAAIPAGSYTVTLNGNAVLRHVVRRVDPIALPTVSAPPYPAGTRNVTLNHPGQGVGDWSTLRNFTLNSGAGVRTVPPGTFGGLTANGPSGFIFGVAGASEPAVYALQGLVLNNHATVEVVGPVVLTLASGVTLNGQVGSSGHPEWLTLRIASGGLTLNGGSAVYGTVIAPSGTIVLNGNSTIHGEVISDRLTLNGSASLVQPEN